MEKYTGAKTIGDGTYGSVLKAINKQNGKFIKTSQTKCTLNRRNCGNQKDEEKVSSMGPVHQSKGDLVAVKTISSEHCASV